MYDTTGARAMARDWKRRQGGTTALAVYAYSGAGGSTSALLGQLATGWDLSPRDGGGLGLTVSEDAALVGDGTLAWAAWDSLTHVGVVYGSGKASTLYKVPGGGKHPWERESDRTWRFDLEYVGPFTPPEVEEP